MFVCVLLGCFWSFFCWRCSRMFRITSRRAKSDLINEVLYCIFDLYFLYLFFLCEVGSKLFFINLLIVFYLVLCFLFCVYWCVLGDRNRLRELCRVKDVFGDLKWNIFCLFCCILSIYVCLSLWCSSKVDKCVYLWVWVCFEFWNRCVRWNDIVFCLSDDVFNWCIDSNCSVCVWIFLWFFCKCVVLLCGVDF